MLSDEARAEIEARLGGETLDSDPGVDAATAEDSGEVGQDAGAALAENDEGSGKESAHESSVPYERFKRVNDELAAMKERFDALESRLEEPAQQDDDYDDPDPLDLLDGRISQIEQRHAEQLLDMELNAVKESHPVFKDDKAEDLLLDLIAANPRVPVKDIAARLSPLLAGVGEQKAAEKKPPETPNRPSNGASSATPRRSEKKEPATFEEASKMLRAAWGS